MNCPNCGQPHEPGAVFCGNCGQAFVTEPQTHDFAPAVSAQPAPQAPIVANSQPASLAAPVEVLTPPSLPTASPIQQVWNNQAASPTSTHAADYGTPVAAGNGTALPAYALPSAGQHVDETKAILSLVLGILSLFITFFIYPFGGLVLAIAGIVLGTMSRQSTKRALSTAGLIVSIAGIVFFAGVIAYLTNHHLLKSQQGASAQNSSTAAVSITTPCYTVTFPGGLNVENSAASCEAKAYFGTSINTSSEAYEITTATQPGLTAANFDAITQAALDHSLSSAPEGFKIISEKSGTFAGSQAHYVTVTNATGVAAVYVGILHSAGNGDNLFVIAHAVRGTSADVQQLESQWSWN